MNPNQNQREQMEVRLVALLLGEASAFEEAELQQAMAQDASLAAFYSEMKSSIGLLQEASKKSPAEAKPSGAPLEQPKLSAERRAALLAQFKQPRAVEEKETEKRRDGAPVEPQPKVEAKKGTVIPLPKVEPWSWKTKVAFRIAALFIILGVVAALLLPTLKSRFYLSERIDFLGADVGRPPAASLDRRTESGAKEQWAAETATANFNANPFSQGNYKAAKPDSTLAAVAPPASVMATVPAPKASVADNKPVATPVFLPKGEAADELRELAVAGQMAKNFDGAAGFNFQTALPGDANALGNKDVKSKLNASEGDHRAALENGRDMSPDGKQVAAGDYTVQTWDRTDGKSTTSLLNHGVLLPGTVNGHPSATEQFGIFSDQIIPDGTRAYRGTEVAGEGVRFGQGGFGGQGGDGKWGSYGGGGYGGGMGVGGGGVGGVTKAGREVAKEDPSQNEWFNRQNQAGPAQPQKPGGPWSAASSVRGYYDDKNAATEWKELKNLGPQAAQQGQLGGWKFGESREGGGEVNAFFKQNANGTQTYAFNPAPGKDSGAAVGDKGKPVAPIFNLNVVGLELEGALDEAGKFNEKTTLAGDVSGKSGAAVDPATGKPVQWVDFDKDGVTDLYVQPAKPNVKRPASGIGGPVASSDGVPTLGEIPLAGGLFGQGRGEAAKAGDKVEGIPQQSSGGTVYSINAVGYVNIAQPSTDGRTVAKGADTDRPLGFQIQSVGGAAPVIAGGNGHLPGPGASTPTAESTPVATTATPTAPAEPGLAPLPLRYPAPVLKGAPADVSNYRREDSVALKGDLKAKDTTEHFDDLAARSDFAISPVTPPPPAMSPPPLPTAKLEPSRPALVVDETMHLEFRQKSQEEIAQRPAEAKPLAEQQLKMAALQATQKAGAERQKQARWDVNDPTKAEMDERTRLVTESEFVSGKKRANEPAKLAQVELGYTGAMITNVAFFEDSARSNDRFLARNSLVVDKEMKDLPALQNQGLDKLEMLRDIEVKDRLDSYGNGPASSTPAVMLDAAQTDLQKRLRTIGSRAAGGGEPAKELSETKDVMVIADLTKKLEAKERQVAQNETHNLSIVKADVAEKKLEKVEQKTEQLEDKLAKARDVNGDGIADAPAQKLPPAPPLLHQPEMATAANSDVNFSTFSLNVSDVAFKTAAASLQAGALPDPNSVRVEEFVNAFNYRDPAPARGAKLAFAWERTRYPFAHNRDLLRFAIQTAAQGREAAKPLNLVILLDNSGSMERPDRVQIVGDSLKVLAQKLQPQDKISVVTFSRTARLWVDGLAGGKPQELLNVVGGLNPQGGTDLGAGLELAYKTAVKHFLPKGNNRVIMLTDGAANLGNVSADELKKKVVEHRQKGIALDCFGIGWEGFNDDLLEVLSHNGDGRYSFLNDPEQAAPEFANQLAGALSVAASDVKAQVEFNPARVTAYRQIGYAKHQLTKQQFRDNTVDAAEIAASESGNALYVIQVNPQGSGPLGVVRVRHKVPATGEYVEQEWTLSYQPTVPALDQAAAPMRLAGVAAAFGEWLAHNPYAGEVNLNALPNYLNGVPEFFGPDPRPKQLAQMIRQAAALAGNK